MKRGLAFICRCGKEFRSRNEHQKHRAEQIDLYYSHNRANPAAEPFRVESVQALILDHRIGDIVKDTK